jgi:acetyl esterase/lipase
MKQKFSIDDYDIEVEHPNEYRQLLYSPSANRIPLRINSPFLLEANIPIEPTFLEKVTDLFKTKPNKFSTVILHIHGGGFIGMSSYSHQIYTRKWAN